MNLTPEEALLLHSLTNHPPVDDSVVMRFEDVRALAFDFGRQILAHCPLSRERSLAITNLEQAVMWAIKSIATHQEGN